MADVDEMIARLRAAHEPQPIDARRINAQSIPFLSDEGMDKPPLLSADSFKAPRLRRSLFDPATINFQRSCRLEGGLDGCTWIVYFENKGPYVLKVFWDPRPPSFDHYYAPQRECQNAALIQKMEAAVKEPVTDSTAPILINAKPKTWREAWSNTLAFSSDRRKGQLSSRTSGFMTVSSVPRMRQCYGWLKIDGRTLCNWPSKLRPRPVQCDKLVRRISPDEEYIAIVYEYIQECANEEAVVEEAADFLWRAGFGHVMDSRVENWKSGVLIDLSDIVHVGAYGWRPGRYKSRKASEILANRT
ncbi:hypothetical protein GGR54DRAFT_301640 [Hypoxylon sp. NC1633]|nr:hypothetical protein GGR54DRAFT_301640 [Hypoxylon sp. NC1633]